jgi:membrane-associated phospholipid phosphatase
MAMLMVRPDTREIFARSVPLLAFFSVALIAALIKNESLFFFLNELATFRPLFWLHLTHLGDILVAVSLFGVFIDKQSKLLWSLAISMALSVLIVQSLKHAVNAPRPPAVLAVNKIHVIVPAFRTLRPMDPAIDYAKLIDAAPDTVAAWQNIQSNPNSLEAHYWVPRMGGVVTKEQFGMAHYQESLDVKYGTYRGIYRPSARSFPSGHTATIVCALALIMLHFRKRKWAWGLALVALAVGGSRIVVGVHWPVDVAVGGLIGWATAVMGTWIAHHTPIASTPMGHRMIALLPGLAALVLLIRNPVYPDIAIFEVVVGLAGLLLATTGLWRLYRRN